MTAPAISDLRAIAIAADLEGREVLDRFTDTELRLIYNRLGPDSFPAWLRNAFSDLNRWAEPGALVHDADWYLSDGTREGFDASNARLRRNLVKLARYRYGWADPRRYVCILRARRFAAYCQAFGYSAWRRDAEKGSAPAAPAAGTV
jgi:hypothetical protein